MASTPPNPLRLGQIFIVQWLLGQTAKHLLNPLKLLVAMRVAEVYGLLSQAYSRTQIHQHCADNWDVGIRQADEYIKKARLKLEEDCQLTRQEFLAECLHALAQIRDGSSQAWSDAGRCE